MNQKLPVAQALTNLRSSSTPERDAAIQSLFNTPFSEIGAAPISTLIQALGDPNEGIRDRIVTALGKKGSKEAVPFLIGLLPDHGGSIRRSITDALERIGLPEDLDLLSLLDSKDRGLRHAAVIFLGRSRDQRAIADLTRILTGDASELLRCDAADALANIGAPAAVPALTAALRTGGDLVSYQALLAIKQLGVPARPALIEALGHSNVRIRKAAAIAFAHKEDPAALPGLRSALQDLDVGVRMNAVHTLSSWIWSSHKRPEGIVAALEFALDDEAPRVRRDALEGLVRSGDRSFLPRLFSCWNDVDDGVHRAAAGGLQSLVNKAHALFFINALHDPRPNRRASAAAILGKIGCQTAVPELLIALQDENRALRKTVIDALTAIGATSAVPQVIANFAQALAEQDAGIELAAARALGRFADPAAVPTLILALRSHDIDTRIAAADALGAIGSSDAVAALSEALTDSETTVRAAVASALGRIGDPTALLALRRSTSDDAPIIERHVLSSPGRRLPLVSEVAKQASTEIWRSRALKTVQISANYPKEVAPYVWHSAHMYIFTAIAADQVAADIRTLLGRRVDEYRSLDKVIHGRLKDGIAVRVTPLLDGFEFNPAFHLIQLYEPWHRVDFRLRAGEKHVGKATNGTILTSIDGVVVADISISIYVGTKARGHDAVQQTGTPIGSIFCSYSHEDEQIAERVERVCRALGIDYLRDRVSLKSGQKWNEALLAMIDQADLFQLFWSKYAAASGYVDKEWRHAYSRGRDATRFIRPVFWAQPMPAPPRELANLHFAFTPELSD